MIRCAALGGWVLLLAPSALAHSSPPAMLRIAAAGSGTTLEFRVPRLDGVLAPVGVAIAGLTDIAPPTTIELPDAELRRRTVAGAPDSFAGRRIAFPGLERTDLDVLVRREGPGGWTAVAGAREPRVTCPPNGSVPATVMAFAASGTQHILLGPDHLLFVLGLLLLVRDRRSLIATVSSFTLAHAISLAVATIGAARGPAGVVNALIGLSILCLGTEIAAARRGRITLGAAHPALMGFGFGLLHGFGYASALTETGLAGRDLAVALVSFNVGVEAGQLGFLAVAMLAWRSWRQLGFRASLNALSAYAVGIPGACWTVDRCLAMLGAS